MAAGEQHRQLVVLQRGVVVLELGAHRHVRRVGGGHPVVAQAVERLAPRRRRQPRAGALGSAAAVPVDRRGDERVLHDVLGQREVAVEPARDGGQHGGALVAVRPLERAGRGAHAGSHPTSGRISTEPYSDGRRLRGDRDRGVEVGHVEEVEGEQDLLRLGVRAVGDGHVAAGGLAHGGGRSGVRPLAPM